jgi:hypothetical protein
MDGRRTVITAVLALVVVVLGYMLYETIAEPIRFQKEKEKRYAKVIERLKQIRTAELTYREVKGKYCGNFDSLIYFLKHDSLPLVKKIGMIPDSLLDSLTEEEAVRKGLIVRDTVYIPVLDSILKGVDVDSIRCVPYTNGAEFTLKAGEIEVSGTKQPVFEAVDSKPFDPSDVLKVGSMEEVSTSGNWE